VARLLLRNWRSHGDAMNRPLTIKDYADYASKIWAGVLALLGALIALKLNK
jgi:hypothetical protein